MKQRNLPSSEKYELALQWLRNGGIDALRVRCYKPSTPSPQASRRRRRKLSEPNRRKLRPPRGRIRPHKPETPRAAPHLSTDSTDTPPEGSAELFNRFHKPAPRIRACADLSFLRPSHPWKPAGPTRQKCPATDRACKSRRPRELRVRARPTRAASSDRFRNPNEANHRRRRRAAALPPSAMPFDSAPP